MNLEFVYVLLYINNDSPESSEVLGVFKNKEDSVDELLERANYREKNGKLTQYLKPTNEYISFDILKKQVEKDMLLKDDDTYIITKLPLL